jgi:hypothetical protein
MDNNVEAVIKELLKLTKVELQSFKTQAINMSANMIDAFIEHYLKCQASCVETTMFLMKMCFQVIHTKGTTIENPFCEVQRSVKNLILTIKYSAINQTEDKLKLLVALIERLDGLIDVRLLITKCFQNSQSVSHAVHSSSANSNQSFNILDLLGPHTSHSSSTCSNQVFNTKDETSETSLDNIDENILYLGVHDTILDSDDENEQQRVASIGNGSVQVGLYSDQVVVMESEGGQDSVHSEVEVEVVNESPSEGGQDSVHSEVEVHDTILDSDDENEQLNLNKRVTSTVDYVQVDLFSDQVVVMESEGGQDSVHSEVEVEVVVNESPRIEEVKLTGGQPFQTLDGSDDKPATSTDDSVRVEAPIASESVMSDEPKEKAASEQLRVSPGRCYANSVESSDDNDESESLNPMTSTVDSVQVGLYSDQVIVMESEGGQDSVHSEVEVEVVNESPSIEEVKAKHKRKREKEDADSGEKRARTPSGEKSNKKKHHSRSERHENETEKKSSAEKPHKEHRDRHSNDAITKQSSQEKSHTHKHRSRSERHGNGNEVISGKKSSGKQSRKEGEQDGTAV